MKDLKYGQGYIYAHDTEEKLAVCSACQMRLQTEDITARQKRAGKAGERQA